jgi:hypothetical protein
MREFRADRKKLFRGNPANANADLLSTWNRREPMCKLELT